MANRGPAVRRTVEKMACPYCGRPLTLKGRSRDDMYIWCDMDMAIIPAYYPLDERGESRTWGLAFGMINIYENPRMKVLKVYGGKGYFGVYKRLADTSTYYLWGVYVNKDEALSEAKSTESMSRWFMLEV